jgi:hypothetical protein
MPDFLGSRALRGRSSAVSPRVLNPRKSSFARGFTLIELVVITAIIAIISGLILVSDSAFGGKVLLENLAYDIALSIRQAQVYGISVQRFGSNVFSAGYGVRFDTSSQLSYLTFADALIANGMYDCPTPGSTATCELVQSTAIERGFRIAKLCAPAGTDSASCISVSKLDILFIRPEPDAIISANTLSCPLGLGTCYDSARIVLSSPRGDLDSILIESNGQISVEKK